MDYETIANEKASVSFNKQNGQLISLKTDQEYIHPGGRSVNDTLRKTEGWAHSDTTMFPIVSASKDNLIIYEGVSYNLDQHGIVRAMAPLVKKENRRGKEIIIISYSYTANSQIDNSEKHNKNMNSPEYMSLPFGFNINSEIYLDDKLLKTKSVIENTSDKSFCFAYGRHPAFNSNVKDLKKGTFHYVNGDSLNYLVDGKMIPLNFETLMELSKTSAPFIEGLDGVLFYNSETDKVITVESDYGGIMLWSPSKNMFCAEPVTEKLKKGTEIDLSANGSYRSVLKPGEKKTYSLDIRVV
ncbi:MAG: hypothetical protein ACP5NV_01725 [Candidatus Woesearchaeota archaeon]